MKQILRYIKGQTLDKIADVNKEKQLRAYRVKAYDIAHMSGE